MVIIMRIFLVRNVKILIVSNVLIDLNVLNVKRILYYMPINVFITFRIKFTQIKNIIIFIPKIFSKNFKEIHFVWINQKYETNNIVNVELAIFFKIKLVVINVLKIVLSAVKMQITVKNVMNNLIEY